MTDLKKRIEEELKELTLPNLLELSRAMVTVTQVLIKWDEDEMPYGVAYKTMDTFWDMVINEQKRRKKELRAEE